MGHKVLLAARVIGMGALDTVARDALEGLSDLYGKWLGLEALVEVYDASMGGPETRT